MFNIGERIRKKRLELNMSQEELAKRMGYSSRSSINKIEKDGRGLPQSKIVKISEILQTTPSYLMGWDDEEDESVIIGRNIQFMRTQRNISLVELAEEIHIDYDILVQYEKGIRKIPLDILRKFASYFNTSVDNLMGIELEAERKHVVITNSETLKERYKKWQEQVGYNNYTDKEIDQLIEIAKLMKQMNDDEITKLIEYGEFILSRNK